MPETPRTALVTGATSGIGLAIATALAERGHRTFIAARTADAVTETVARLREQGHEVAGTVADVRSTEQLEQLVDTATAAFGDIEILVNNAGRSGGGQTSQIADELWDDIIETNLNSVFRLTRHVLGKGGLEHKDWGRIINIASTAGKQGVLLAAPYSASKHGVVGFTKALGKELAPTGITVNAVCPGYVETPMAERVRSGYAQLWQTSEQEVLDKFNANIPLGRYSTPGEVAGLVSYLASEPAASITAQAINVCGGLGNF
ncbi:SDR family NAD(P)-dependent oxidoreductase [Nocardia sp. R7R-8]|uniref:SDR family NAD(P)-dependent oxidoreductase n=1 Tax=Nocardia sp. R7R-8 TaxID=3459304 RepID=UPI00403DC7F4